MYEHGDVTVVVYDVDVVGTDPALFAVDAENEWALTLFLRDSSSSLDGAAGREPRCCRMAV